MRWLSFGIRAMLLLMVPLGFGFVRLRDFLDHRPIVWAPYSKKTLQNSLGRRRIVLVSFRGGYDFVDVMNEKFALDTSEVRRAMRVHHVVAMKADWKDASVEMKPALASLGETTIPLVVIYPAHMPGAPVVLRDVVTEKQVLAAIEKAARAAPARMPKPIEERVTPFTNATSLARPNSPG